MLWSELDGNALELSYLDRRNKGKSRLMHVNAHVEEADKAAAQEWCQALMAVAYTGVQSCYEYLSKDMLNCGSL